MSGPLRKVPCAAISGSTHGIEGHISLNYYQSPADSTLALNRVTGAAFPYAKFSVSGGSPSYSCEGYADANGKYSAGLSNAGTYTVTFYVESDTVSIGRWELGTGEPIARMPAAGLVHDGRGR